MSKAKQGPKGKVNRNADLPDSARDQEKLKNEDSDHHVLAVVSGYD